MGPARYNHDATLLPSGKVFVTGGIIGQGTYYPILTSSAELYDPSTGKWTTTGSMSTARFNAGAALLQNGQVLVAGGLNETLSGIAIAELYDPSKGAWNTTGSLNLSRATPATLLPNGQVLMAGGNGNTAELYNPFTAKWTLTATMYFGASGSAAPLTNGDVLSYGNHLPSYASEFYDPSTNTWKRTFGQNTGNISGGPLALLNTGKLLLAGGTPKYGRVTSAALLYDPSTNYWTFTGALNTARVAHTLTRLLNGQVLAAGGGSLNGYAVIAELYTP
jgi:N-acetylneuraminic acid mutarotase